MRGSVAKASVAQNCQVDKRVIIVNAQSQQCRSWSGQDPSLDDTQVVISVISDDTCHSRCSEPEHCQKESAPSRGIELLEVKA
eukprot:CAMPEP_0115838564 /NCGR_PEP_ID=MMETSP0287-20121206/5793_1 /TAXON_ID=412157 /ORGANISM="Chrysochromulina rotalis, Strain UIO044" /LENGTH=82 /DNA_ID=CAMNT_0003292093 /DNA_START=47 /DNA_END=295 /DNA_ORIENTATION=+